MALAVFASSPESVDYYQLTGVRCTGLPNLLVQAGSIVVFVLFIHGLGFCSSIDVEREWMEYQLPAVG